MFCAALSALAESCIARARLFLYFLLITGTARYVLLTCTNTTRIESCHNDFSFVLHHWHLTPFTVRHHAARLSRLALSEAGFLFIFILLPSPKTTTEIKAARHKRTTAVIFPLHDVPFCLSIRFPLLRLLYFSFAKIAQPVPCKYQSVLLISAQNFNTLSAFSS